LKVIDRKKNLVKTLNGEYIALEKVYMYFLSFLLHPMGRGGLELIYISVFSKLESVYRSSPIVSNICVYASPQKVKPIALIVPAEPALKQLAAEAGIPGSDDAKALIDNPDLRDAVHAAVLAAGRKGGLAGIELVCGVVLVREEWLPQNVSRPRPHPRFARREQGKQSI
jgi:long-chain acyl-CoA synthetase